MKPHWKRAAATAGVALLGSMAGCGHPPAAAPAVTRAVHYRCEGGQGFAVLQGADSGRPVIDLRGMRFQLEPVAGDASGERHACSQIALWRRGLEASLEVPGAAPLSCRVAP